MASPVIQLTALKNLIDLKSLDRITGAQVKILQDFGIMDSESFIMKQRDLAINFYKADSAGNVTLNKEGVLIRDNGTSPGKSASAGFLPMNLPPLKGDSSSSGAIDEIMLSGPNFMDEINFTSIEIDTSLVVSALESFAKTVKREGGYLREEIKIVEMTDSIITIQSLVAAGTKILDASLYVTMQSDETKKKIFKVLKINEITNTECGKNLQSGLCALIGAILVVYNRGNLPSKTYSSENRRPLQNLLVSNVFHEAISFEDELAEMLSSAPLFKYPAGSLLEFNLNLLEAFVGQRAKLSIAGNKVVRLAVIAGKFEKQKIWTDEELVKDLLTFAARSEERVKIMHSNLLVEQLKSYGPDLQAQLRLHPLAKNRHVPAKFVGIMIKAILMSLSNNGRNELCETLLGNRESKKMGSYTKDQLLMGSTDEEKKNRTWSILTDKDYDVNSITVDGLKSVFASKG
jgi:hypothetical protein